MTLEERKERWRGLYRPGSGKFVYLISVLENPVPVPPLWPDKMSERLDFGLRLYETMQERAQWLDDDAIPYLFPATGTEIFAETMGAEVYRPNNNMPFAIHFIEDCAQAAKLRVPDPENTTLMDLVELTRKMRDRAGKDAVIKLPAVMCPFDILAQLWDKEDLYASLMDENGRKVIQEVCEKLYRFIEKFWDIWFAEFGTSFVAHCPDYYMEGGLSITADEIGNLSSTMFDTFFREDLNRFSRHFGGIGIHCCANARHQWAGLKKLEGLQILNLCRELPVLQEGYRYFDSCAHAPMYLLNGVTVTMPDMEPQDFPAGTRGVIVQTAATKAEAIRKAERLRALCR